MLMTLSLPQKWVDLAQQFGDINNVVEEALRAHFVTQAQAKMTEAERRIAAYRQKYQCDYDAFSQSVQTDAAFLERLEARNPQWEVDAMEWQYWLEEQAEWRNRQLPAIVSELD